MNSRMLDYTLREAATGIRIMARDKSSLHVFDWGRTPDGEEYVFVMACVPKAVIANVEFFLRASRPLTHNQAKPPAEA